MFLTMPLHSFGIETGGAVNNEVFLCGITAYIMCISVPQASWSTADGCTSVINTGGADLRVSQVEAACRMPKGQPGNLKTGRSIHCCTSFWTGTHHSTDGKYK